MFCHPNFITNKIFEFLNASIDWSKKNNCYRNNFNLMCLQYTIVCLFPFITELDLILAHAASWHLARLGPNNFILLQSG